MVSVRRVESNRDLGLFVMLPFRLYRGDPNWVPPLISELKNTLTPGRNPFWEHAERELFLAEKEGRVAGRIAAIFDRSYNEHRGSSIAFFGFFESEDDREVASALLDAVTRFARDRKATAVYGPANPSMNDECGLLVGPFDSPPVIKMSYNPEWYAGLIEQDGFTKVKDMHAYAIDTGIEMPGKLQRVMARLKQKPGLEVRPLNLDRLEDELALVKEVYNDAWSENWDFVPMADAEIVDMARQLKPLAKADICPIVMYKGEAAAMCIALPDYNQVMRKMNGRLFPFGWLTFLTQRKNITQLRVWALGVKRKFHGLGLDSLLYYEAYLGARRLGYKLAEVSMILENNLAIIRPIQLLGGRLYKRYRVYQRPA